MIRRAAANYDVHRCSGKGPEFYNRLVSECDTYMDEIKPWKRRSFTNFTCEKLQKQIFAGGELVYELPTLKEIQQKVKDQLSASVWPEEQRFENPHTHYVDLSMELYRTKQEMLEKYS